MKAKIKITELTIIRKRGGQGATGNTQAKGKPVELSPDKKKLDHLRGQIKALDARITMLENAWYRRILRYLNKPIKFRRE